MPEGTPMQLPSGSRLGPYEIADLIGIGGMGEVYRARDTRLGRTVAIKILSLKISTTPGFRERFASEARAVSSIEHPNICALYDIGREDGVDFLVMQYLDGETLAERLRRGPIAVPEALRLARQIANGLEAAHQRGILHRDLKPSNIKLTPDGNAKILDFGLAKTLSPPSDPASPTAPMRALTETGLILGTAGYMSPEQTLGGVVDKRTDVWAFGCVLFEMLTARRAFEGGSTSQVLAAVVQRDPDWTALPAGTPPHVRSLLRRCLQKDPVRRTRDIGDVGLDLEDTPAVDANPPRIDRIPPLRRPSVAWSITALAAAILAVLLFTHPFGHQSHPSAMRFSSVTTFSGVEAQPALSPDGRSVAFVSNQGGQWDVYVGLVSGGNVVRITNDPEIEARPRWSPDGANVLFSRMNDQGLQDVWMVPALGGTARRLMDNAAQPAWSPDGRSIAYVSNGAIWICDATGENPHAVTRAEPPLAHNLPAFSHDGRKLVFVRRSDGPYGELAVVDLKTGSVRRLTRDGALAWSPVWSPDDKSIYFTSSRGGTMNIWKMSAGSGGLEQITAGQGADMEIDLSADGTRLVYSSFRTNLNLAELSLDPATLGQRKWLTSDAARSELSPRYSSDGRYIAYFSNRTGSEREAIWVMDADGENQIKLVEDDSVNVFPRWTADGQHLVYSSHTDKLEDPEVLRQVPVAGGAPRELPVRPWRALWGDVAPDGRLIYQTSQEQGEVYDPRTGKRQTVSNLPGFPFWSRDGRLIAYAVRPGLGKDSDVGLWVGDPFGPRQQVFQGWVLHFAWTSAGDILVLQGKADFKGILWRVDTQGDRQMVLPEVPVFRRDYEAVVSPMRFDVHPDGRRIVIEALELLEADIGMIDHVR
jgi:eukaryotic-like serine/threonine-protein kinase